MFSSEALTSNLTSRDAVNCLANNSTALGDRNTGKNKFYTRHTQDEVHRKYPQKWTVFPFSILCSPILSLDSQFPVSESDKPCSFVLLSIHISPCLSVSPFPCLSLLFIPFVSIPSMLASRLYFTCQRTYPYCKSPCNCSFPNTSFIPTTILSLSLRTPFQSPSARWKVTRNLKEVHNSGIFLFSWSNCALLQCGDQCLHSTFTKQCLIYFWSTIAFVHYSSARPHANKRIG